MKSHGSVGDTKQLRERKRPRLQFLFDSMRKTTLLRTALVVAFLAWMAGWFWTFGYSFSSNFFRHNLDSRFPLVFMKLLAVAVPPLSGYWAVTRTIGHKMGAIKAFLVNLAVSAVPLLVFAAVLEIWLAIARRQGELAFEADEAMGIGIDFLFCQAAFLATNLIVASTLVAWQLIERNRTCA